MAFLDYFGYKIFRPRKLFSCPKKILLIRTAHIGDVLFTTPLLANVRLAYPEAQIDYLCGDWALEVIRNNPNINNIRTYNSFWLDRKRRFQLGIKTLLRLRKEKYDLIIQGGFDFRDHILARIIGAKYIIGYSVCGFGFLLDRSAGLGVGAHDKDSHLELLKLIEKRPIKRKLEIFISDKENMAGKSLLEKYHIDIENDNYIVISPGAGNWKKFWFAEHWAKLFLLINRNCNKIVVLGTESEMIILNEIMSKINDSSVISNVVNLIGKATLMESAAIIKRADAFIGLDSALVHIANALGVKSVSISRGFSDMTRWVINDDVTITLMGDCGKAAYCDPNCCSHRNCLYNIKPDIVYDAFMAQL